MLCPVNLHELYWREYQKSWDWELWIVWIEGQ